MENIVIATQCHALRFQMDVLFGLMSRVIVFDSEDKVFETDDMDTLSEGVDINLSDGSLLNLKYGRKLEATLNGKPVPLERERHQNELNKTIKTGIPGSLMYVALVLVFMIFLDLCETPSEYAYMLSFFCIGALGGIAMYFRKIWLLVLVVSVTSVFLVISIINFSRHPMYRFGVFIFYVLSMAGTALYHILWLRKAEKI